MPLEKDSFALILLGASKFPKSKYTASEAFLHAKTRIKDFFYKQILLEENDDHILDLFDTTDGQNEIDERISEFLTQPKKQIKDLIIYYVGHGGYDNLGGFILAIQTTRDNNLAASSITAQMLGRTLSLVAREMRIFLILDCCFAAEMFTKFQSPFIDIVQKEIADSFPENGLALLCASSKDEPGIILENKNITMFTDGLDTILRSGSSEIKEEFLTLRDIGKLTYSYIKKNSPLEAIRPEVHSPIMPTGDIADIRHFPNSGYRPKGLERAYDTAFRKKEIENEIEINNLREAGKKFSGFVQDFDRAHKYTSDKVLLLSECNELEDNKPSKENIEVYKAYKTERLNLYSRILIIINEIYPD